MKKLNRLFIKGTNWALAGLLSLLGFACSSDSEDDLPRPEYGSPHADYSIKGKVINKHGEAIPGLLIEIVPDKEYQWVDSVNTQQDGAFVWNGSLTTPEYDISVEVITSDIDGDKNGSFLSDTTNVYFTKEDLKDPGGFWYNGKAEKEVIITLKEKSQE